MKKNFIFTETDAQKFKAKFEECRNEVGKKAKKGKVVLIYSATFLSCVSGYSTLVCRVPADSLCAELQPSVQVLFCLQE